MSIGRAIEACPLRDHFELNAEILKWLGQVTALVGATQKLNLIFDLKVSIDKFVSLQSNTLVRDQFFRGNKSEILKTLYQALAISELSAPISLRDSFIPAGHSFDAMLAIKKILESANEYILVIDPYLDASALTDFMILANESISIRLFTGKNTYNESLIPSVKKWKQQHIENRILRVKLCDSKLLHDRLIIVDGTTIWDLTQSLNAFATRAPASISKFQDPNQKLELYSQMWDDAETLSY